MSIALTVRLLRLADTDALVQAYITKARVQVRNPCDPELLVEIIEALVAQSNTLREELERQLGAQGFLRIPVSELATSPNERLSNEPSFTTAQYIAGLMLKEGDTLRAEIVSAEPVRDPTETDLEWYIRREQWHQKNRSVPDED